MGFIGSHLVDHYLSKGNQVCILDNFSTNSGQNYWGDNPNLEIVKGDIRDTNLIENIIPKTDLVLHMAAALGVSNIINHTIESISTNILGSEVVLRASARYKKRIIIASTSEIYGKNPKQPLSEEDDRVIGSPQNIRWSYSDAKAIEEATAKALAISEGLNVTTLRFFNTVGPRQTGRYGMVLPRFISSAITNQPLIVHGDGSQTRVFCHVSDAVSAVSVIANRDDSIGEVFNIGGTGEISIGELAKKVVRLTNSQSEINFVSYESIYPIGFEDMARRVPNTSKIRDFCGWNSTYTIDEIILDIAKSLNK